MPKRKSKILYIDTNVILDYISNEDNNVIVLMNSVKSRDWKLRSSTFAMIELAEYRRNEIYLWDKLSQKKSLNNIIKKIKNSRERKNLKSHHFEQVSDWLDNLRKELPNLDFLDLDRSKNPKIKSSWDYAYHFGIYSNMNAKDVIHLSTAITAALNKECDFFITSDGDLFNESIQILKDYKLQTTIKVMKPKEFIEKYPPIKRKKSLPLTARGAGAAEGHKKNLKS